MDNTNMDNTKPFKGTNVGTGAIDVSLRPLMYELRPVEIYLKEDGALDNGASFAIVMEHPKHLVSPVIGQLSLKMFNEGLAEVGYKIVPINE